MAFIFRPGGLNRTIRPVKIAENLTIKRRTTGFGLKRPGHGVAASFFKGDFGLLFQRGGGGVSNTQFSQRHTLRLHTLLGGNEATLPALGIAHTHLPTTATGLDDVRHRGWAWK
jgi:hypothetical protein